MTSSPADPAHPSFSSFLRMLGAEIDQDLNRALGEAPGYVELKVAGNDFVVACDPAIWGEGQVAFVCDFGEIPDENRVRVLEHLLAANMQLHGLWSPVFAINGLGRLVSIMVLPLGYLDREMTMQTFARHVAAVERWNTNHFLERDDLFA